MSSEPTTEAATAETPFEFDPLSEEFFQDPSDVYRRLRDEHPVYRSERYGFVALSRWDDVVEAHRNWREFSSAHGVDLATLCTRAELAFESLIMIDPPRHDRLRGLVSRVFTPRAVAGLEPMVREVVCGYLDDLEPDADGVVDIVADVAAPFPVEIICRMLGVPAADRQQVRHWIDAALTREVGRLLPSPDAQENMAQMGRYFYDLAVEKRRHPDDDMISRLTEVEILDDDGLAQRLDDVEIAGFGTLLAGAGAETVTKLIGSAVVLFADHPEQWAEVVADPGLIPGAVEEVLRYHPPSQYQGRFVERDVVVRGVTIPADTPVILVTGAATHDPRAFDDPDRFDIHRPPALSVAFGHGIHSCLGAALARLESRVAVEEIARRHPGYELVRSGLRRVQMSNVAGWSHVPIRVA